MINKFQRLHVLSLNSQLYDPQTCQTAAETPSTGPDMTKRFEHLDMIRGLAALLVCAGHARGMVVADRAAQSGTNLLQDAFYLLTSLGHQSVVLFFALSGFLVGGRAFQQIWHKQWRAKSYALKRVTRLWTVLLPALILTLMWDVIGAIYGGSAGYIGNYFTILSSGPAPGVPADHSLATLIINIAFLQTVAGPAFGTNGPLWSLANEFWYYVIAPIALIGISPGRSIVLRIVSLSIAILWAVIFPREMVILGSIWIAGALAFLLNDRASRLAGKSLALAWVATLGWCGAGFLLSLTSPGLIADLTLGFGCAAILPLVVRLPSLGGLYGKLSHGLSEISYTLYVSHYPMIFALSAILFLPFQFNPDAMGLFATAALILASLAQATILWWCFERNTDRIRMKVEAMLSR
jgi:peptidoglycan/LPS O-acetylase OafA/YrhL